MFSRLTNGWVPGCSFSAQKVSISMVLYFESKGKLAANLNHLEAFLMPCCFLVVDPPVTIYMGKDKFESRLFKRLYLFSGVNGISR